MQADPASRRLTYAQALQEATEQVMAADPRVIVIGEGVPDPKAIFGTTAHLRERFGAQRVFDMPLSENALTGVCIGAALAGMRPVMVHQRIDFALLAMDQLVNNAAKWHFMFNGQGRVPLVVRMIVGRGWGQGPQHSQGLHSLFAHVPGLRVVLPSNPHDAKGMFVAAVRDDNPVVFVEHRWTHGLVDEVPAGDYDVPLDRARVLREGSQLTIAGFSLAIVEALHLARVLAPHGIDIEVLDMRSARPLDVDALLKSVRKTGRLIAVDAGWAQCGLASELVARAATGAFSSLRAAPAWLAYPDQPSPTSPHLARHYFPETPQLLDLVLQQLGCTLPAETMASVLEGIARKGPVDVPNDRFTGPF
jgi:pyruvate dehydrogenase E1 component beta subunit